MGNMEITLRRDVEKKEFKWLSREFKKDEKVQLYLGNTYDCIGNNGIACSLDGKVPFFELPATFLQITYENCNYGVFMTEKGHNYTALYCKELPFVHMDLLDKIQRNRNLSDVSALKSSIEREQAREDEFLLITIKEGKIYHEVSSIEVIDPLF